MDIRMSLATKALGAVSLVAILTLAGCNCKVSKDAEPAAEPASAPAEAPASEASAPQPKLFLNLGLEYYTPDGMAVDAERETLWLNVPNFGRMDENMVKADSHQGGYLLAVTKDGTFTKELEYPIYDVTGQTGPMGCEFGPDGNLYVCDNQAFHNKEGQSHILRVVMENGRPTGEVQTVVEGVCLANGIRWKNNTMFYTDSILPFEATDEIIGAGGVFAFSADEVLTAGTGDNPPVKVVANQDDPHCIAYEGVVKVGRGDNTGADGITVDNNGVVWFGNFGNGMIYAIYPDENGAYSKENCVCVYDPRDGAPAQSGPYAGLPLECYDGCYYSPELNLVLCDDSVNNAIWAYEPVAKGEKISPRTIWKNDDTDGTDGLLDQPAEAIVFGDKVVVVHFDWPFPGMVNGGQEGPGTGSYFDLSAIRPAYEAAAAQ